MGDYKLLGGSDVETGFNEAASAEVSLMSQERYPDATEKQAKLLCLLDEAAENSYPKISPPFYDVGSLKFGDFKNFLSLMKLPSAALISLTLIALVAAAVNNPILTMIFPYWVAFANTMASITAFQTSFDDAAVLILGSVHEITDNISARIDELEEKALKTVSDIEDGLEHILIPIKPKLKRALKMEKQLKRVDSEIKIPDASDLEEELSEAADKIAGSLDRLKDELDIQTFIPGAAKSKGVFDLYIVYPVLAVYLVMQLVLVYLTTSSWDDDTQDGSVDFHAISKANNFAEGSHTFIGENSLGRILKVVNATEAETYGQKLSENVLIFLICLQAYLTSVVSILVVFLMTREAIVKRGINLRIGLFVKKVNLVLEEYLAQPFEDILSDSMISIKEKLLDLIESMERLEGPLARCHFLGL